MRPADWFCARRRFQRRVKRTGELGCLTIQKRLSVHLSGRVSVRASLGPDRTVFLAVCPCVSKTAPDRIVMCTSINQHNSSSSYHLQKQAISLNQLHPKDAGRKEISRAEKAQPEAKTPQTKSHARKFESETSWCVSGGATNQSCEIGRSHHGGQLWPAPAR